MRAEQSLTRVSVKRISENLPTVVEQDSLASEEPLEIRLGFYENGRKTHKSISITMRTPGEDGQADFELAAGFLFTEGIISSPTQIKQIQYCGLPAPGSSLRNTVRIDLEPSVKIDFKRLERHFYTSSSCGVCGKSSIEALETGVCSLGDKSKPIFEAQLIHSLPNILRAAQSVFEQTGGLHAAALFDAEGNLQVLREDVGRHNAVDKLVGSQFLTRRVPLDDYLLLVSGRASFELVQKALMAGIPILAAVGAPSSLAVQLADNFGMTLLGFVRNNRFNIYTHPQRIKTFDVADASNQTAVNTILAEAETTLTL